MDATLEHGNNFILILPWLPDNTNNDDDQPKEHKHSRIIQINMNNEAPLTLEQECWEKHLRPAAKGKVRGALDCLPLTQISSSSSLKVKSTPTNTSTISLCASTIMLSDNCTTVSVYSAFWWLQCDLLRWACLIGCDFGEEDALAYKKKICGTGLAEEE